ncbi:MAG: DUF4398 domain-containing protein [Treponema sp.]|nr:DUF4398 domain-containing protein [Treponema sp.]MCL2245312.1 DUF4398 domain-containing protein [Treponema sp.]
MKMKFFCVFIISLIILTGCEKPPEDEMQAAREAVFRAENDANASEYANSSLERARDALRRMQIEADSKRYDAAKTLAAEAIAAAERAIADGRAGVQRAGGETQSAVTGLRDDIEETSRNINGARYNQMNLDYDELDRQIVDAHSSADRVESDQNAGRYQEALDRARELRADLAIINQTVARAVPAGKK